MRRGGAEPRQQFIEAQGYCEHMAQPTQAGAHKRSAGGNLCATTYRHM